MPIVTRGTGLLLYLLLWTSLAWAVNPVGPKIMASTDTGAPTISGTVGELNRLLDETLIIKRMFTAISGASFVDNSIAARLQGSTAYKLFQGPTATNDEAYFGLQQPFEQIAFVFGTPGVQGSAITLSWQYWNGSAWTTFTPDSDTTTKFTANGTVAWTIANLTGWATTTVNSIAVYWVRVRFTAGTWSTNPLAQTTSITGWTRKCSGGTNQAVYQMGAGNQFYLDINNNGPGAGTSKEARVRGWESITACSTYDNHTGSAYRFPTVTQQTNGLFVRISTTADATTRAWKMVADDRTFYLSIITGDVTSVYYMLAFGDFYSVNPTDPYRTFLAARTLENSSSNNGESFLSCTTSLSSATNLGFYLARDYVGSVGGAYAGSHHSDSVLLSGSTACVGQVQYPNGADGRVYSERMYIHENTTATIRGYHRGLTIFLHNVTNIADGDVVNGTVGFAGRAYKAVRCIYNSAGTACGSGANALLMETTNTWDTN